MISFRAATPPGYHDCNSYCLFFLSSQLLYCGSQYCHSRPLSLKGLWCSICAEWTATLEVLIGAPCFHSGAGRLGNHCHLKQQYVYYYEPACVTTPMNSYNADTCFYICSIVAVEAWGGGSKSCSNCRKYSIVPRCWYHDIHCLWMCSILELCSTVLESAKQSQNCAITCCAISWSTTC